MKTLRIATLFGLVALTSAAGIPVAAQERGTLKVIFGTPPTTYNLPHFVARSEGMFDKAGLKIEDVFVNGDSNAVRGLVSGGADAAGTNLLVAMQAIAEGARIKIIGAWQPRVDYQILVQERIKTMKDLAGARIATASAGGITQRIPEMVMTKYGVDMSGVKFTALGGHEARMKAVITDKVDASVVGMLYAARAMKEARGVKILGSIADDFPALGFTFLVVLDKDLADPAKRRLFENYVRAGIVEGSRFIMANPARAAEIMHTYSPETPLDMIREVVTQMNRLKLWGVNGGMEKDTIGFTAKLGKDMGVLKREMAPGEGVDYSLSEKAVGALGTM